VRLAGGDVTTVNSDFPGTISGIIHCVSDKNVRPITRMGMTKTRLKIYIHDFCVLVTVLRRVAGRTCSECCFPTGPKTKTSPVHVSLQAIASDTKSSKVIADFYDAADHEDKLQLLSTHYGQAIKQHCDTVMAPSTISRILACQNEEQIQLILGQLIEELGSNSGLTPITTGSVPPGSMSIVLSQQPTVGTQNQETFSFRPPPEQPFLVSNSIFNNGNWSTFSNSTGLNSDANSSQPFQIYAATEMHTNGTAPSDQMSTSIDCSWTYNDEDSSGNLSQLQQMTPSVSQPPTNSIDHNVGFDVAGVSQVTNPTNPLLSLPYGSQYPSSYTLEGLGQSHPQSEGRDEERNPGSAI
jgi:hypothetical protein